MRELTMHELDVQLAEQLPARELMGGYSKSSCGCNPDHSSGHSSNTFISQGGNGNGSHDGNGNFLSPVSGDLDGNLSGNSVVVTVL